MLNWLSNKQIWLYQPAVDFRKQLNGLLMIIENEMGHQPADGGIYLFRNRRQDKLKVVLWDRNGFWLGCKTLETGRYDAPKNELGQLLLNIEQLYLLISGLPMQQLTIIPQDRGWQFS